MKNLIVLIIAFAISQNVGFSQYDVSFNGGNYDSNLLSIIESEEWLNTGVDIAGSSDSAVTEISEEVADLEQDIIVNMNTLVVDDLKLDISMNLVDIVEVRLYSEDGAQVKNLRGAQRLSAGSNQLKSNLESLDSGEYLVVVYTPSWTSGRTITKL